MNGDKGRAKGDMTSDETIPRRISIGLPAAAKAAMNLVLILSREAKAAAPSPRKRPYHRPPLLPDILPEQVTLLFNVYLAAEPSAANQPAPADCNGTLNCCCCCCC